MTKEDSLLPFERIKRTVLVRKKAKTDAKFGGDYSKRPVEELVEYGVINIDKPKGPTSHQVSAYVQKILDIKKSGHSGTLDPKVTGVLPVAIGRATRIVQTLLKAGKEYIGIMHLHKEVEKGKVENVFREFIGKIKQLPPLKSSVKREWRFRKIYYLDVLEIKDKDVLFKVGCQAGTYIRKLCYDIGEKLGVSAHMAELRRTKAGPFNETELYTLQDLADAYHYWKKEGNGIYLKKIIKPIEDAVLHLPKVWVLDSTVDSITHGAALALPGIAKLESDIQPDDTVAMMTLKDEFIALGTARMTSKQMMEERGIGIKTDKVFMQQGVYPRIMRE